MLSGDLFQTVNFFHELTAHSAGQEIPNCIDKFSLRQSVWLSEEQHADSAEISSEYVKLTSVQNLLAWVE